MSDVRMNVWKVLYDSSLGSSVVLLQSQEGDRVLPIWVGQSEALSIAVASENIKMARPMTHDLLKTFVETIGMSIEWIRVTELRDGTFFAVIRAATEDRTFDLDSRPSDAIALALRVRAPIFVAEQVLAEAMGPDFSSLKDIEELEEDFLANLPDEIFGKYKM